MTHDELSKIESALTRNNEMVIKAVVAAVTKLDKLVRGANPLAEIGNIKFFHGYLRQIINFITENATAKSNYDFSPELDKLLKKAAELIATHEKHKTATQRAQQSQDQKDHKKKKLSVDLRRLRKVNDDKHASNDDDIANLAIDTFCEPFDDSTATGT